MIGSEEEQRYVIEYKMAKLGFSPSETEEMNFDRVQAYICLQDYDEKKYWETAMKLFAKMFGGK